jgi:hypothetical protein
VATDTSPDRNQPSDWLAKVLVPLVGTGAAVFAALLSAFLVWFTNDKTRQIQERLAIIQQDQFASEQSARLGQFNRESERQYVGLVYNDLLAKDKDAARQRTALSLLQVLAPETGLKLLAWAQQANVILPENQAESRKVEGRLEALQANGRFRLFLHTGVSKGRAVPEVEAIKKALAADGYTVLGVDDKTDAYGPGIDYFNDADKQAAESIAKALTSLLPGNPTAIPVRKQSAQNRAGTIGIWF